MLGERAVKTKLMTPSRSKTDPGRKRGREVKRNRKQTEGTAFLLLEEGT